MKKYLLIQVPMYSNSHNLQQIHLTKKFLLIQVLMSSNSHNLQQIHLTKKLLLIQVLESSNSPKILLNSVFQILTNDEIIINYIWVKNHNKKINF